jgi:hypothetical protein
VSKENETDSNRFKMSTLKSGVWTVRNKVSGPVQFGE